MADLLMLLEDAALALGALALVIAVLVALWVFWPYVRTAHAYVLVWICDAIGGGWNIGGDPRCIRRPRQGRERGA